MEPGMPSFRATALRPALLVAAGLVVVAAVAAVALRDRGSAPAPLPTVSPQAATQPEAPKPAPSIEKPSFDVVRINPQGNAVMAGHATPGSDVTITDAGKVVGHAQADQNGDWVFTPATPLPPGARELSLAERAPDGSEAKGDRSVLLVVPEAAASASGQSALPPLAVLTGPNAAPLVLTGPAPSPSPAPLPSPALALGSSPTPGRLAFGAAEYDEHGEIRLSGTAAPGATVRIYVDNHPIGQAVANPDGQWLFSAGGAVGPGPHRLRLDQIAPNGTVASRLDRPFTRELLAAALPPGHVAIQPGQNLWTIARQTYGQGMRYTVIYQANQAEIRNPDLIYPGQVFAVPDATAAPAMPASSSNSR
jgi:LysM domain